MINLLFGAKHAGTPFMCSRATTKRHLEMEFKQPRIVNCCILKSFSFCAVEGYTCHARVYAGSTLFLAPLVESPYEIFKKARDTTHFDVMATHGLFIPNIHYFCSVILPTYSIPCLCSSNSFIPNGCLAQPICPSTEQNPRSISSTLQKNSDDRIQELGQIVK